MVDGSCCNGGFFRLFIFGGKCVLVRTRSNNTSFSKLRMTVQGSTTTSNPVAFYLVTLPSSSRGSYISSWLKISLPLLAHMSSFRPVGRRRGEKKGTLHLSSADGHCSADAPTTSMYELFTGTSLVVIIAAMETGNWSLGPAAKCPANIRRFCD